MEHDHGAGVALPVILGVFALKAQKTYCSNIPLMLNHCYFVERFRFRTLNLILYLDPVQSLSYKVLLISKKLIITCCRKL